MKNIKIFLIFTLLGMGIGGSYLQAGEGMWLPLLLQALEDDMQSKGMKLSAEDIYSVNQSSLKDAVVRYGNGCTGAIISPDGLLLTNHHCGLGRIQAQSSVEHDYITDGFWAGSKAEELPNPGLTATFIVRIEDITQQVLAGLREGMDEAEREAVVRERGMASAREAVAGTHYGAMVQPFYNGNEYYLFVVETFRDVRLVGAPPSAIGKFGGDTDNWVWPRHNADFSLFRIYAGPDGLPADYSEENVPLKPRHFFPISLKPKTPGDFTLVFGFPGRTNEYLPSDAVEMVMETVNPIRIGMRSIRLDIMEREMKANDTVRIQYTSKQSGISNGYIKWQGESRGLKKAKALDKKRAYETEFQRRVAENPEYQQRYGSLLSSYKDLYTELAPLTREREYYTEAGLGIEAVVKARNLAALEEVLDNKTPDQTQVSETSGKIGNGLAGFFKNYSPKVDRQLMAALLERYMSDLPRDRWPEYFLFIEKKFKGDTHAFADYAFANSVIVDQERFEAFLAKPSLKALRKDPVYALAKSFGDNYRERILPDYSRLVEQQEILDRSYMAAQRELFSEKVFYPDANSTLRVAYGQIEGYSPDDGKHYLAHTTLDGLLEKHFSFPENDEYDVPDRLIQLYREKAYGRYAQDGQLWTGFVASNHTTGGNSGSPVIDGEGNLIGLNFDRNWEGTMSDLNYDRDQCRNISADIRYVLWVIDKYAGASYLIDEMKIVE